MMSPRELIAVAVAATAAALVSCGMAASQTTTKTVPAVTVVQPAHEVLRPQPGNAYGFEGGEIVRSSSRYWYFATELTGAPVWAKTTLGLWSSSDGNHWQRVETLFGPSSGDQTGTDRRAAIWSPMPVFDESANRWCVFYIGYRSNANGLRNADGEVWESTSRAPGVRGITGPYANNGVVLSEEHGARQSWEGAQGDDSFEPFQLPGGSWEAFYGSSDDATIWRVGLAHASNLNRRRWPWTRSRTGPLSLSITIENPVVERLSGGYVAVYDDVSPHTSVGCMYSRTGLAWRSCPPIQTATKGTRTPVGLVPTPTGSVAFMFFTACPSGSPTGGCFLYSETVKLRGVS
jgi:hypothetical protein